MMNRHVALISDIHGNLPALKAVLDDIDRRAIPEIICLGDVIGYGPFPAEVTDLIRARCSVTLWGNHEEAMVHSALGF